METQPQANSILKEYKVPDDAIQTRELNPAEIKCYGDILIQAENATQEKDYIRAKELIEAYTILVKDRKDQKFTIEEVYKIIGTDPAFNSVYINEIIDEFNKIENSIHIIHELFNRLGFNKIDMPYMAKLNQITAEVDCYMKLIAKREDGLHIGININIREKLDWDLEISIKKTDRSVYRNEEPIIESKSDNWAELEKNILTTLLGKSGEEEIENAFIRLKERIGKQ